MEPVKETSFSGGMMGKKNLWGQTLEWGVLKKGEEIVMNIMNSFFTFFSNDFGQIDFFSKNLPLRFLDEKITNECDILFLYRVISKRKLIEKENVNLRVFLEKIKVEKLKTQGSFEFIISMITLELQRINSLKKSDKLIIGKS